MSPETDIFCQFLFFFLLNIDNKTQFVCNFLFHFDVQHILMLYPHGIKKVLIKNFLLLQFPAVTLKFTTNITKLYVNAWQWLFLISNLCNMFKGAYSTIQCKIQKVPMGIQGEKSSKDMASSRNLVRLWWQDMAFMLREKKHLRCATMLREVIGQCQQWKLQGKLGGGGGGGGYGLGYLPA